MEYSAIIVAICAAILGGMGTAIVDGIRESGKEKRRQIEREQDHLKMDLKDLKIELFQIEKELTEWKDKYYSAIQELIEVKGELDAALRTLSEESDPMLDR